MKYLLVMLILTVAPGALINAIDAACVQDSVLIGTAKAVVEKLAAEDFCGASENFDTRLKQTLTTERLQEGWAALIQEIGAFKKQLGTQVEKVQQGYCTVIVSCEFDKSAAAVRLVFDGDGKVVGLWTGPGSGAQSDSDGSAFKAVAKRVLDLMVNKNFAQIREMFNDEMKNALTAERMNEVWTSAIQTVGAYRGLAESQYRRVDGYDVVVMRCECETGYLQVRVAFDAQKKIGGLYVLPSQ